MGKLGSEIGERVTIDFRVFESLSESAVEGFLALGRSNG